MNELTIFGQFYTGIRKIQHKSNVGQYSVRVFGGILFFFYAAQSSFAHRKLQMALGGN